MDRTKWEIFNTHKSDPEYWNFQRLSTRYGYPMDRIQGIIFLKARLSCMLARGELPPAAGFTRCMERKNTEHLEELGKEFDVRIENHQFRNASFKIAPWPTIYEKQETRVSRYELKDGEDEENFLEFVKEQKKRRAARYKKEDEGIEDEKPTPAFPMPTPLPPLKPIVKKKQMPYVSAVPKPKKPNKKKLFAVKDLSDPEAPTRIVDGDDNVRLATDMEDVHRTWTARPHYVSTQRFGQGLAVDPLPPEAHALHIVDCPPYLVDPTQVLLDELKAEEAEAAGAPTNEYNLEEEAAPTVEDTDDEFAELINDEFEGSDDKHK